MGIEEYNLLKSTLEEVSILREKRKRARKNLEFFKKNLADWEDNLADREKDLATLRKKTEEGASFVNVTESQLEESRQLLQTAKEVEARIRENLETVKRDEDGGNRSIVLIILGCALALILWTSIDNFRGTFECDDGEKISYFFVNDGEDDCRDGSDERATAEENKFADDTGYICAGFGWLILLLIYAIDEYMGSEGRKKIQKITSELDEAIVTKQSHSKKIVEHLRGLNEYQSVQKLPELIATTEEMRNGCVKHIEDTQMDIQSTTEDIQSISKTIEEKMNSISHLIPYSEFLPEK